MSELTTDPITEAVARGMYEACPLHKDGPAWSSPELDKDHGYAMTKRQWYLHEATAAIAAYKAALKAQGYAQFNAALVARIQCRLMAVADDGDIEAQDLLEDIEQIHRAMIQASEEETR